jgi:hypothetical protein
MAIWFLLWSCGTFSPHFGKVRLEKSGNPGNDGVKRQFLQFKPFYNCILLFYWCKQHCVLLNVHTCTYKKLSFLSLRASNTVFYNLTGAGNSIMQSRVLAAFATAVARSRNDRAWRASLALSFFEEIGQNAQPNLH